MLITPHIRKRRDSTSRGFTLLELLVVIVIIGLLATYVGLRFSSQLNVPEGQTAKVQTKGFGKPEVIRVAG